MSCYLTDLLHYDLTQKKHSDLKKSLIEYQFLLLTASAAMKYFQADDLEKFDSLVGENACQIRAIKVAVLAQTKKPESINFFILKIDRILLLIDEILEFKINNLMQEGLSLKEVIESRELHLSLTLDEMFLLQSYLLAEMKECQSNGEFLPSILRIERCSPSMIQKKYPHISYSFVDKLAKKLRPLLSDASVKFVRETATTLNDPLLIRMVSKHFELEHNKLTCVPTFWCFNILFSLAQRQSIPLVLHAKFLNQEGVGYRVTHEEVLYFKFNPVTNSYNEINPTPSDLTSPACIIQGVICPPTKDQSTCPQHWKRKIQKFSIIDMILAMGADHRQYPNEQILVDIEDIQYEYYKKLAEQNGFALSNPTNFFVQHIYCSQAGELIPSQNKFFSSRNTHSRDLDPRLHLANAYP